MIAGQGINLKSSDFQGGLIANKDIGVDTTSRMQGPMISVYHTDQRRTVERLVVPADPLRPLGRDAFSAPPPVPRLLPPQQFGGG